MGINFTEPESNLRPGSLPGDMHTVSGSGFDVAGVEGSSQRWNGVYGTSASPGASGVYGDNTGGGIGVGGRSMGDGGVGMFGEGTFLAGKFVGNVEVTGEIRLSNADCAEDFDIGGTCAIDPGTVMVLNDEGGCAPVTLPMTRVPQGVATRGEECLVRCGLGVGFGALIGCECG